MRADIDELIAAGINEIISGLVGQVNNPETSDAVKVKISVFLLRMAEELSSFTVTIIDDLEEQG